MVNIYVCKFFSVTSQTSAVLIFETKKTYLIISRAIFMTMEYGYYMSKL